MAIKRRLLTVCVDVYTQVMTSDDIIKRLTADGWKKVHQKGSHVQFRHALKPGKVTVPHPKKDLPLGTAKNILKQAGLKS